MSQEITVNASISVAKGNIQSKSLALSNNTKFNMTGGNYTEGVQTVPTTAGGTAIPLGPMAGQTLGWAMFKNLDATNYVELLTAASGTVFAKLKPGECWLGRLGSGAQAPAAQANTTTVDMEYCIIED